VRSTRQGTRILAAIVNRKVSFNKFKKFYIWCKLTNDRKSQSDRLKLRTKNVLLKWLRNNKKAAFDKWTDCTKWHRRITAALGLGPKRLLSDIFSRWRLFVKKSKATTPTNKYVCAILNSCLSKKALTQFFRYFFKWKAFSLEFHGR